MNKFKKYLSEHPEAAAQYEKTGSISPSKDAADSSNVAKKSDAKSGKNSSH